MLYPTLFIGLGTTGVDILVEFQKLILEHYGQPSLPIFAYVALETDRNKKVELPSWASSEISLIHPIIITTDAIRNAIHHGEKDYLKDWLNERLLNIPGGSFQEGASNIRMAGRLCLWENWAKLVGSPQMQGVAHLLLEAQNRITAQLNIEATDQFLRSRYTEIGKAIPPNAQLVGDLPNIYLVGTLCGGTCSGMFIDLGYYVKHLFGLWAQNLEDINVPKVIGLFTVYDSAGLRNAQQEKPRKLAANCWAALLEYDHWCHPESRYQVTFPDGTKVGPTNEKPIDLLYLLSCSGFGTHLRKPGGTPDEAALKHMAAMALFTETVGDLFGEKERIRTDFRGRPRALETSPNEHTSCIATCGIATAWYPKYRIAEAAACRYGRRRCEEWRGTIDANSQAIIEKTAQTEWRGILERRQPLLTSSPDGALEDLIGPEYESNKERWLQLPPEQLIRALQTKLQTDLNENGRVYQHIRNHQSLFRAGVLDDIEEAIRSQINSTNNLTHVSHFLTVIDKAVQSKIARPPMTYPAPDLSQAQGDLLPDVWSKPLFMNAEVLKQKKEELIADCQAYEVAQVSQIRDFRTKHPLGEIRQHLGVELQLPQDQTLRGVRTIQQKLDAMVGGLNQCITAFDTRATEMGTNLGVTQEVRIITQKRDMPEDIDVLGATLEGLLPEEKERLRREFMTRDDILQPLHQFLGYGVQGFSYETIYQPIRDVLLKEGLRHRASFNIAEELQKKYDPAEIRLFARHAAPHLELAGNLASRELTVPPEFIIGKDWDETMPQIQDLADRLNAPNASDKIRFANLKHDPELDHMLIFYKEEGLIYMDRNLATEALFEQRYQEAAASDPYGLHTHTNGRNFFDIWIAIRRKEAEDIMKPLLKEIFSIPDQVLLFSLGPEFQEDLYNGNNLSRHLHQEFQNHGIVLPQSATLFMIETDSRWRVTGNDKQMYIISKAESGLLNIYNLTVPDDEEQLKWASSEIFDVNRVGRLVFQLPGSDLVLTLGNMVESLAQEKQCFDSLKERFKAKLNEIRRQGFDERLNQLLNRVEQEAMDQGDPDPIQVRNAKREEYRGPEGVIQRLKEKGYVPEGFFPD